MKSIAEIARGFDAIADEEGLVKALTDFAAIVQRECILAEREACAKVCEEKQSYSMPIPCPDGISGCLVLHSVPGTREKTGKECAAAIRARGDSEEPST